MFKRMKEMLGGAPSLSREQRIAESDLLARPFTRALLLRAAAYIDESERDLKESFKNLRPFTEADNLQTKIAEAASIVALNVTTDAMKQLGRGAFLPFDPIPKDAPLVVAFSIFALVGLHGGLKAEGHTFDFNEKAADVGTSLFLMHSGEEWATVVSNGMDAFKAATKSDSPGVREWHDNLMKLIDIYVMQWTTENETLKETDLIPAFGSLLKSLLSVAE